MVSSSGVILELLGSILARLRSSAVNARNQPKMVSWSGALPELLGSILARLRSPAVSTYNQPKMVSWSGALPEHLASILACLPYSAVSAHNESNQPSQPKMMVSWSDALPELLGSILARVPSPADHASFRAVCSKWRSAARLYPCPLPWLVCHDGSIFSLSEGAFHRLRLPEHTCLIGAIDGWLAFGSLGQYQLLNPFSQATIPLAVKEVWQSAIRKVVMRSPDDDLVVVRTWMCNRQIVIYQQEKSLWLDELQEPFIHNRITDAVFHEEKLYLLTATDDLVFVELTGNLITCNLVIKSTTPRDVLDMSGIGDFTVTIDWLGNSKATFQYLVESHGKLLMVKRVVKLSGKWPNHSTCQLDVFEADVSGGVWTPVRYLPGRALFVGKLFSKSVEACGEDVENLIYFKDEWWCAWNDPIGDTGVYDIKSAAFLWFMDERRPPPPSSWVFPPSNYSALGEET